ncbi:HD domain-containing protein [Enterococcus bulliens]
MSRLVAVQDYAKQQLAHDQTGHDYAHVSRVAYWAKKILDQDNLTADHFITLSAAYLHDVIDDKVVSDSVVAKEHLRVFLATIATEQEIAAIFSIIEHMSFSANLAQKHVLTMEGQIVQDADRLDALGAYGILRTAYYGGSNGHPIYDETIAVNLHQDKATYRKGTTVINHFYEKLFLLVDQMNTQTGKKEAKRRERFMQEFLTEFYHEIDFD